MYSLTYEDSAMLNDIAASLKARALDLVYGPTETGYVLTVTTRETRWANGHVQIRYDSEDGSFTLTQSPDRWALANFHSPEAIRVKSDDIKAEWDAAILKHIPVFLGPQGIHTGL